MQQKSAICFGLVVALMCLSAVAHGAILPRQDISKPNFDLGDSNRPHGWYDAQCQGATNDYCRFVGDVNQGVWWSCALAGSTQPYSPDGMFTFETTSAIACSPMISPRWNLSTIDQGYSTMPRGWYDAQCQGAANDYCRWVGDHIQGLWFSCALAGSTQPYSPAGMFTDEMTSKRPCSPRVEPRWNINAAGFDKGYNDTIAGWYDAQCQGATNDYCRIVGDGNLGMWFSCALAGATNQYSPVGLFGEATTSKIPCKATPSRWNITADGFDKGYTDQQSGWYDALCRGIADDYCRVVGDSPAWWSCALAGDSSQYSPKDMFTLELTSNVPCRPRIQVRWDIAKLDQGYSDNTRGWFDAQCQGASNDYCRWVGDSPAWWSCALAGSTNQYSPRGMYQMEKTSQTPCHYTAPNALRMLSADASQVESFNAGKL